MAPQSKADVSLTNDQVRLLREVITRTQSTLKPCEWNDVATSIGAGSGKAAKERFRYLMQTINGVPHKPTQASNPRKKLVIGQAKASLVTAAFKKGKPVAKNTDVKTKHLAPDAKVLPKPDAPEAIDGLPVTTDKTSSTKSSTGDIAPNTCYEKGDKEDEEQNEEVEENKDAPSNASEQIDSNDSFSTRTHFSPNYGDEHAAQEFCTLMYGHNATSSILTTQEMAELDGNIDDADFDQFF